jgi:hypothetical protein
VSDDGDCNKGQVDEVGIVNIGWLITMDEDGHFDNVEVLEGLSSPMNRALIRLHETMVEIIIECVEGASIELCDHGTSLYQNVASNIQAIHLA